MKAGRKRSVVPASGRLGGAAALRAKKPVAARATNMKRAKTAKKAEGEDKLSLEARVKARRSLLLKERKIGGEAKSERDTTIASATYIE